MKEIKKGKEVTNAKKNLKSILLPSWPDMSRQQQGRSRLVKTNNQISK